MLDYENQDGIDYKLYKEGKDYIMYIGGFRSRIVANNDNEAISKFRSKMITLL